MKFADIVIGQEYGAHDNPTQRRGYSDTPRKVEVLEQTVIDKERWGNGFTSRRTIIKKKAFKVKMLDAAQLTSRYSYDKIRGAAEGAIITIEPRLLVAPWEELSPGILAKVAKDEADKKAKEAGIARVTALVGKRESFWVRVRDGKVYEIEFQGNALEHILSLAEKGSR
jgi:hypothetical protein